MCLHMFPGFGHWDSEAWSEVEMTVEGLCHSLRDQGLLAVEKKMLVEGVEQLASSA